MQASITTALLDTHAFARPQVQRVTQCAGPVMAGRSLLLRQKLQLISHPMQKLQWPRQRGLRAVSQETEEVEAIEVEVKVSGMTCEGCSSRVQKALQGLAGVDSAEVALESGIAKIQVEAAGQLDALYTQLPRLVDAIRELGFDAEAHFGGYEED